MMHVDFPYRFDAKGRTAEAGEEGWIRDLIEQVLFTPPGERVNRPTFGSDLMRLVFAPNSDALAAAVQTTVHGALQQWLGELILVESVDVLADGAELRVTVQYRIRRRQERRVDTFTRVL